MFENNSAKWKWIFGFLIVANIVYYFYSNWGLVTVKATDVPLSKIISSIEWQGWVKIYTNLPLDTKVTMFVDHVPLAEAMETLALGILGKLSLWQALALVAEFDERVRGENYRQLAARALEQHDRVEAYRLNMTRNTFNLVAK